MSDPYLNPYEGWNYIFLARHSISELVGCVPVVDCDSTDRPGFAGLEAVPEKYKSVVADVRGESNAQKTIARSPQSPALFTECMHIVSSTHLALSSMVYDSDDFNPTHN